MTSGAKYSSVPTKELARPLGCAASSMPPDPRRLPALPPEVRRLGLLPEGRSRLGLLLPPPGDLRLWVGDSMLVPRLARLLLLPLARMDEGATAAELPAHRAAAPAAPPAGRGGELGTMAGCVRPWQ